MDKNAIIFNIICDECKEEYAITIPFGDKNKIIKLIKSECNYCKNENTNKLKIEIDNIKED